MRTTKPISTISYNSVDFLTKVLDRHFYLHNISYYEFIVHQPDTDGKKEHIHLYIEPAKYINTEEFATDFVEPDPNNPDKPFVLQPFRSTGKYGDWYWYVLHNEAYLKSKMMSRNVHYGDENIISSCPDYHQTLVELNPLINFTYMSDNVTRDYVCQCVYNGVSLAEMLSNGHIALGKTQSVISLYNALMPVVNGHQINNEKPIINDDDFKFNKKYHFNKVDCSADDLPFQNEQLSVDDELFD